MAKKPPTLTVIDSASKPDRLAPPASLGKAGAELWGSIHHDYVVEDSAGCQMLLRICETADGYNGYATGQNPNMRQRTVLQHLSLAEWRVVDRLPVSVSELTLSKLLHHGWIESRSEGHHMAIRLTPAGLEAMRSPV